MGISHGDSVIIHCSAASNPVSRYTIYRNQTVLLNNSLSGVLTIASFSESDSGNYSCMAKNAVNSSTADGVWFSYVKPIPTTSKYSCFVSKILHSQHRAPIFKKVRVKFCYIFLRT